MDNIFPIQYYNINQKLVTLAKYLNADCLNNKLIISDNSTKHIDNIVNRYSLVINSTTMINHEVIYNDIIVNTFGIDNEISDIYNINTNLYLFFDIFNCANIKLRELNRINNINNVCIY